MGRPRASIDSDAWRHRLPRHAGMTRLYGPPVACIHCGEAPRPAVGPQGPVPVRCESCEASYRWRRGSVLSRRRTLWSHRRGSAENHWRGGLRLGPRYPIGVGCAFPEQAPGRGSVRYKGMHNNAVNWRWWRDEVRGRCDVAGCLSTDLTIDHDHATGLVRGVLCRDHNWALGRCGDTFDGVAALAAYASRGALRLA